MTKKKYSVYHGPVNVGGIGGFLSQYQKKKGLNSDFVTWYDCGHRQNHDFNLAIEQYQSRIKKILLMFFWFLIAIVKYDVFHFYYGKSLLPFGLDLPILRLLRKKILMTYCGSEVRLVFVEKKRNNYAHLLKIPPDHPRYDKKKLRRMRWHNLWCHKFIIAREIVAWTKEVIPEKKLFINTWIHNLGFDINNCPEKHKLKTRDIPLVVHAPSSKDIKGTQYVHAAVQILREKGCLFEYKEVTGVPNAQAQAIYKDADIIIDQFIVGAIGTLACEGMGLGKPVVAYVPKELIDEFMPGCPIFNATIDDLAERLELLIRSAELRLKLGYEGIEFIKKHLDPTVNNEAIIALYDSLFQDVKNH